MTALLGGNGPHNMDGFDPALAASWGAACIRFPLLAERDPAPAIRAMQRLGILPLPVLVREAFEVGGRQVRTPADWAAILEPLGLTHIQALNEPDGTTEGEGASWVMDHPTVNTWLSVIRDAFPRPRWTLLGPGLVSGNAGWLAGVRVDLLDYICPHPYAKEPRGVLGRSKARGKHPREYPPSLRYVPEGAALGVPAGPMLAEYGWYGRLAVSEYDSRTPGMGTYLRDHPLVDMALCFCLHAYDAWGLVDHESARLDFIAATGGAVPVPPPEEPMPEYQLGIAAEAARLRSLGIEPGRALEDEDYPYEHSPYSYQFSERGLFVYSAAARKVHFFEAKGK